MAGSCDELVRDPIGKKTNRGKDPLFPQLDKFEPESYPINLIVNWEGVFQA